MRYKKIVLLINCLFLLISILFINVRNTKNDQQIPSGTDGGVVQKNQEVLSQSSGLVGYAKVIRVIDGDTIEIENGKKVRYIGINSPEKTNGGECYSSESTGKNSELVLGKTVRLEKDISERDKYDRLLRYVYVDPPPSDTSSGQGVFVNEVMVSDGYATVATYPPDVKYKDTIINAERRAREEGKGLWGECRVEK